MESGHALWCESIILGINPELETDIVYGYTVTDDVIHAYNNGMALVSRSTTGMSDLTDALADEYVNSGCAYVRAHYSNNLYQYTEATTEVGSIISVRDVDGSWGPGSEFTLTEYTSESGCTAYMAGKVADYGYRYQEAPYEDIRNILRATASNDGTLCDTTGYGTPDWQATEDSLMKLYGE